MDSEIVDTLSYVELSKHRIKVITFIGNKIKRFGEIARKKIWFSVMLVEF